MGSTHPPLESLLRFSQNCLEGFELSRLNRIANLRKEFQEILAEWIEFEIEARFARWLLERRSVSDSFANRADLPAFGSLQIPLGGVTHSAEQLLLPTGDEIPLEFPFVSLVELGDGVAFELRLPLRHLPVSQDASAALRSLEHFASCEAQAIGEQPLDLLDLDAPDSSASCPFLPFPQPGPAREIRNVAPPKTCVHADTDRSAHYVVRYASAFVTRDRDALAGNCRAIEIELASTLATKVIALERRSHICTGSEPKRSLPAFAISTFATSVFALPCRAFAS